MSIISDEKVYGLINEIYENITDSSPEKWLVTFNRICELVSSGPGSLSILHEGRKQFKLFVSTLDQQVLKDYDEHYHKLSPFRKKIEKMGTGEVFTRAENLSDDAFRVSEIYQKYFKRQNVFHFYYEVLFRENGLTGGISFSRPESGEDFNQREFEVLRIITPHIKRALYSVYRINAAEQESHLLENIINRIPHSVIVINKEGRTVYLNENARKIIAKKDGLQIDRDGSLVAGRSRDTVKLKRLLKNIFYPDLNKRNLYGGTARIQRPSGRKPFSVLISPIPDHSDFAYGQRPLALIFITDPEKKIKLTEKILCDIYELTPAEANMTRLLTEGLTVKEICSFLDVTNNTARTHLKHIFAKTDTKRQSELIKVVLMGPANLVHRPELNNPLSPK